MVLAMLAVGFLGVVIERVAYPPMLSAPRLSILITALAVSLVLQNTLLTLTKGQYTPFGSALGFGGVNLGALFISYNQMILVGTAGMLMLGLELFVSRTQYGRAMRAVAVDKDMCRLMGINVNAVIARHVLSRLGACRSGRYHGRRLLRLALVFHGLPDRPQGIHRRRHRRHRINSRRHARRPDPGLLESFGTQCPASAANGRTSSRSPS